MRTATFGSGGLGDTVAGPWADMAVETGTQSRGGRPTHPTTAMLAGLGIEAYEGAAPASPRTRGSVRPRARTARYNGVTPMRRVKIIVERHPDAYVAYPLGMKGVVVGQGDTYEAALADVKSAIKAHIEAFGTGALEGDPQVLEAFVAEARLKV